MRLRLADLGIDLHSDEPPVNAHWSQLFAGWDVPPAGADSPDLRLHLSLAGTLPPLPPTPPRFIDPRGIVNVYDTGAEQVTLHFLDGALVTIPLAAEATPTATGVVTRSVFGQGRFEDVTYTSLAPLLRRRGYFLMHAFAAGRDGRAILLVGPSGSGKTTTGLNLVLNGWDLLANDVVLLDARPGGIVAHPTPNDLAIRPKTLDLLPRLKNVLVPTAGGSGNNYTLSADVLSSTRPDPAPVTTIFFPHVAGTAQSALLPQPGAIALALLMEESIDSWDRSTLLAHAHLLEALCRQANSYTLRLGTDAATLPTLLAAAGSGQ